MSNVVMKAPPKFIQSERIQKLAQRSRELAISGKRRLGTPDAPLGDHACWIHIGPFPKLDQMPSKVNGYEATGESWGRDYAFLVDNFPVDIYENERIVGEIHWEMHMVRQYIWPESVLEVGRKASEMGAGGYSSGHTCPDLSIGLSQGWGGILERIKQNRDKYIKLDNKTRASYLHGLQMICEAVIRFIQRHAEKALELAQQETDPWQKQTYHRVAECCAHIASNAPRTYYEGVQWIHFAVMLDRVVGHGNGYGRLDLYLIDLYRKSKAAGDLSDEEAREYLSEIFLKLRGQFFSLGGRDAELKDATNEMSFVVLEAYDLIGDYNNLGVMWHPDINRKFYDYACDVLARHGESIPVLVNYGLMREAELRSGIPEEDAWKVVYSGCQWFCIPGKEFCDQDVNSLILPEPMKRTISVGIARGIDDFETFYALFEEELTKTARALREWKNSQYELLGDLWPEMFTSMNSHGPIERGIDMVAARGVDYQYTSVNILGIPNVADSFHAIKKLVFEKNRYTLAEVKEATETNWRGREPMRQRFLNQDKFGNDLDEVDALFVRITKSLARVLGSMVNLRGQEFRASLFHFQGHVAPSAIGATPDGRLAEEYLAHGINPQVGRNTTGLLATANSIAKADERQFQGGPMQVELQPKFFDGKEDIGTYVRDFSETFFKKGGMQINLNIMDLNKLRDAMDHPENPAYQNIIVRVTGYASRFICLSRAYQKEFVERMNYEGF
ncbi:MAG TPA: pyruvate formate lyase family protein [Hyphomicrobiaceae bacterium]|nr:pyruvate formate lyase family protein [Hyphomicrobiaceae bacterium]